MTLLKIDKGKPFESRSNSGFRETAEAMKAGDSVYFSSRKVAHAFATEVWRQTRGTKLHQAIRRDGKGWRVFKVPRAKPDTH